MIRVLLADDEPLILSGIKSMADWASMGCELTGTARNGQQAADLIHELRPDIVITDIIMPVMNGLELLRVAHEKNSAIVFIMLTNLQEFDLVRESMRLGAVDYLVKTQLDEPSLRLSLERAIQKVQERKDLSHTDAAGFGRDGQRSDRLRYAVTRLIDKGVLTGAQRDILQEQGVLAEYSAMELWLPPEEDTDSNPDQSKEPQRLKWLSEMTENLANACFPWHILAETEEKALQMLHGGKPEESGRFTEGIIDVSQNVVGVTPAILLCGPFGENTGVNEAHDQMTVLRAYRYFYGTPVLRFDSLPTVNFQPLRLRGIPARLTAELNSRKAQACADLLDYVSNQMKKTPHERSEMLWLFGELDAAARKALRNTPGEHGFRDESGYGDIEHLTTLTLALRWLLQFKNEIVRLLEPKCSAYAEFLEKARHYVLANTDKRILLKDAARYACISPAYLSSLFKKEYNLSFIDFVNQTKMERACALIREGGYRIGEISYILGYENADYFSKVFRRHMAMTPSEYMNRHR